MNRTPLSWTRVLIHGTGVCKCIHIIMLYNYALVKYILWYVLVGTAAVGGYSSLLFAQHAVLVMPHTVSLDGSWGVRPSERPSWRQYFTEGFEGDAQLGPPLSLKAFYSESSVCRPLYLRCQNNGHVSSYFFTTSQIVEYIEFTVVNYIVFKYFLNSI